ncbi:crotonase/enoyl-CoA hydratase family protein [Actinophytocola gossypii]|uniref:Crotonase/enoyl-CoA hydratase family protein n=1 Tax=Actinophytocola gossypii TaxID=2812003 RepID=A0ABT2J4N4_9PSEU|nr:crotonase/enoyl-CoA hydratase family protein [Actinophytocola gossypii]MCT2582249.1 crotonase/enoyl-CoA hydratase family protein [Actinophytocola gossypii]
MSDELVVTRHDDILLIEVNRPAQRNAMTRDVAVAIDDALTRLDGDPALRVAVLTGRGGVFCAGMDLKRHAAGERAASDGRGFGGIVEVPPRKPVIAAVEGWALGGGFEIVLACDLVVAGATARFGLPEVKRGLLAKGGGMFRLPARLPRPIALELLLTGDPITAERAAALGLLNEVVPEGQSLDSAFTLARRIAVNAPLSVEASKAIAIESADWPSGDGFALQRDIADAVSTSDDAKEGVRAFAEKRAPVWTGR